MWSHQPNDNIIQIFISRNILLMGLLQCEHNKHVHYNRNHYSNILQNKNQRFKSMAWQKYTPMAKATSNSFDASSLKICFAIEAKSSACSPYPPPLRHVQFRTRARQKLTRARDHTVTQSPTGGRFVCTMKALFYVRKWLSWKRPD